MSEIENKQLSFDRNLPEDVQLFPFQVAGHKHGQGRLKLGILKHKNGNILKPMYEGDRRAEQEISFYTSSDPVIKELSDFLPAFRGTWKTCIDGKEVNYMCLEDVCEYFQKPSVIDIKMGCRTYEIGATDAKKNEQINKFVHGASLGLRITGMKVFNVDKQEYRSPDKAYLRALTPITMADALESYLTQNAPINVFILSGFIHKLIWLDEWFEKQRTIMFTASSLLFIYEGTISSWMSWMKDNDLDSFCNFAECSTGKQILCNGVRGDVPAVEPINTLTTKEVCTLCGLDRNICSKILSDCNLFRVCMIDFSHCVPFKEKDTNYIFGLHKLLDYLRNLLKSQLEKM